MALSQTADGRIARHLPHPVDPLGNQRRAYATPPRGQRRLGSGVAATDDDDVEVPMFHVKHPLLSNAETLEDHVEKSLYIDSPDQAIQRADCPAQILRY